MFVEVIVGVVAGVVTIGLMIPALVGEDEIFDGLIASSNRSSSYLKSRIWSDRGLEMQSCYIQIFN